MPNSTYDLIILGLDDAMAFEPTKPTYAIRIGSALYGFDATRWLLRDTPNFVAEKVVYFDDIEKGEYDLGFHGIPLSDSDAADLLQDVQTHLSDVDAILVYCSRGINRSPAVAMALNDIFKLGYDHDVLAKHYPKATHWPYDILVKEAKKLGLLSE